eukprot:TRINITY_DN19518_c0_g1_i1.p1 TRINITY_DN19518_c0_g1~~TRINITY_DN19518_c0_g1_i1.p1  ORF type:complete len:403 (+),score=89.80 TRINITY_DN19518_c0_g1_i1:38-1246(+)
MEVLVATAAATWATAAAHLGHLSVLPAAVVLVGVYALYRLLVRQPQRTPVQLFNRHSASFEALRRSTFPAPFPNGWWKICDVSDLDNGRIQKVSALGVDLVAFRGANGAIGVLDAFCPHLGAHLGDGRIVGNRLKCAFHGWEFETDGQCTAIPYCTGDVPTSARTRTWTHRVWMDMLFVWFDAEGREPTYEIASLPEIEADWVMHTCRQSWFDMHIGEMAENSADYYHFNYLHAPLPLPVIGRFFTVRYETKLFFEDDRKHACFFDNWAEVYLLNRWKLPGTRQLTRVTFEGPSIVHFHIDTDLGGAHLIKTLLPIEPFRQYSEDRWYTEKRTPRWLIKIIATIAAGALEQDRTVWQHKRFNKKPFLVKGDGPFPAHRRWFMQFFSESSRKVAYSQNDLLQW